MELDDEQDNQSQMQLVSYESGDAGKYDVLQYIDEFVFLPIKPSYGALSSFYVKDTAGQKLFA
eukprot:Awhi_evm1s5662